MSPALGLPLGTSLSERRCFPRVFGAQLEKLRLDQPEVVENCSATAGLSLGECPPKSRWGALVLCLEPLELHHNLGAQRGPADGGLAYDYWRDEPGWCSNLGAGFGISILGWSHLGTLSRTHRFGCSGFAASGFCYQLRGAEVLASYCEAVICHKQIMGFGNPKV